MSEDKAKLADLERRLKQLALDFNLEGRLHSDEQEIEIFRSKRDRRQRKRPWKWLFGHVLNSLYGLRIDYYLIPDSKDVVLCVRGGGHRGYLKISHDWILAEIHRLEQLGDLIYELKRDTKNRSSSG